MAIIIKADILNICECPDTSALPKSIGKAEHEHRAGVQQWLQYSWQNPVALQEQMAQYKQKELSASSDRYIWLSSHWCFFHNPPPNQVKTYKSATGEKTAPFFIQSQAQWLLEQSRSLPQGIMMNTKSQEHAQVGRRSLKFFMDNLCPGLYPPCSSTSAFSMGVSTGWGN